MEPPCPGWYTYAPINALLDYKCRKANIKPTPGSILPSFFLLPPNQTGYLAPIRHFLFFSSLFFILYPIKDPAFCHIFRFSKWRLSTPWSIKWVYFYQLNCLLNPILTLGAQQKFIGLKFISILIVATTVTYSARLECLPLSLLLSNKPLPSFKAKPDS